MNTRLFNKEIGAIFLVIGTEIGAGIFALPIIIAHTGIFIGSAILVTTWLITLYTALLFLDIILALPENISFSTMGKKFLGKAGEILIIVCFFYTMIVISIAYIAAAGSVFSSVLNLKNNLCAIIFVIFFSVFILAGIKSVEYANRFFLILKLGLFSAAIILLLSKFKYSNIIYKSNFLFVLPKWPAIMTTFIWHNIIPTIRSYLNSNKKALRRVIIIGSILPLFIYILWIIAVISNIPQTGSNSFEVLFQKKLNANVEDLMNLIALNNKNIAVITFIKVVSILSITTSFLGASISLFHFNQDLFKVSCIETSKKLKRNIIPIVVTFIVPLLIVIFCSNIFILALNFAGFGAIILFLIIPVIITLKIKYFSLPIMLNCSSNYLFLFLVLFFSLSVFFIQIIC